jgi:hypothetical protein
MKTHQNDYAHHQHVAIANEAVYNTMQFTSMLI